MGQLVIRVYKVHLRVSLCDEKCETMFEVDPRQRITSLYRGRYVNM